MDESPAGPTWSQSHAIAKLKIMRGVAKRSQLAKVTGWPLNFWMNWHITWPAIILVIQYYAAYWPRYKLH